MAINRVLKNPLIKLCGAVVIIYLGLFANKDNPESLGNRLSSENLQKNFGEVKEKSKFIAYNVNSAKKISEEANSNDNSDESLANCGDTVITNYEIYEADKNIHRTANKKFTLGSKEDFPVEQGIIGMKVGEIKDIKLLDAQNSNQEILSMPELKNDFKYRITVLKIFHNPPNSKISCN